ncbi:microtubule-associated tyrosine carboxypeptidase 1 isoform X3 [Monodelphis domestica]|uniref:microtubule-associated tyrosine carboxypeptidase 1 isoform X3 n=1 Tax=Monodelphis domestica TaxID=13616 RepID=UPI0004436397|nr:microtubule-associated tyrosine carboxypeptidase 1 isoform X3 [Monodelphis domestica]
MVLDSGTQAYEQAPPSLSVSPATVSGVGKISKQNGPRLYSSTRPPLSAPSSRKSSLVVPVNSRPSVSQPSGLASSRPKVTSSKSEIRRFSSTSLSHGRIRRSESTCSVGGYSSKGYLRAASSLPHIAKSKAEEARAISKSPCLLVALRPNNLEQERDRFFQSRYTYNPQFEYEEPIPAAVLEKYNEASDKFIPQAVRIIEAVLEKYGTYEQFEASTGGQLLTKCQIWSIVRKYMQKEGCSGEVVVQLSEDLLSQAVMMVENSRPTLAINLTGARQYWLEGMLRHEIGQDEGLTLQASRNTVSGDREGLHWSRGGGRRAEGTDPKGKWGDGEPWNGDRGFGGRWSWVEAGYNWDRGGGIWGSRPWPNNLTPFISSPPSLRTVPPRNEQLPSSLLLTEAPITFDLSITLSSPGAPLMAGGSMGCGLPTPRRRGWPACTACFSENSPSYGGQPCCTILSSVRL